MFISGSKLIKLARFTLHLKFSGIIWIILYVLLVFCAQTYSQTSMVVIHSLAFDLGLRSSAASGRHFVLACLKHAHGCCFCCYWPEINTWDGLFRRKRFPGVVSKVVVITLLRYLLISMVLTFGGCSSEDFRMKFEQNCQNAHLPTIVNAAARSKNSIKTRSFEVDYDYDH